MAVDASIALGVRPMQIENPMNQLAQVMQLKNAQQSNALNAMTMEKHRTEMADENQLRELTRQSGGDMQKLRDLTYGAGNYKQGMVLDTALTNRRKAEAEAENQQLQITKNRIGLMGSGFAALKANPTAENAALTLDTLEKNGALKPEQAQQVRAIIQAKPDSIASLSEHFFRLALDADKQLPKIQTNNIGGATVTQSFDPVTGQWRTVNSVQNTPTPDGQARLAEMKRHHGITESNQATALTKPFEITGADGNPVLVQQDKQGNIRPVQGYTPKQGASKPLNDSQAKANLFGSRMKESHRILNELEGKYSPMAVNAKMAAAEVPGVGGAAGYAGNLMLSTEGQQAEQAQRDFINAVLRRESGAVINPAEFSNGQKQYFPQPGDDKKTLDQKRRNRELAIQGMNAEVPGGLRSAPALTNPGSTGGAEGGWSIQKVN